MATISDERLAELILLNPPGTPVRHALHRDLHSALTELQSLRSQAGVSEAVEPDAYVDWKSQCVWMAENIKDAGGLQPVWFAHPAPIEITEGVSQRLTEILDEDAPNKWVWKTHASQDEWLREKVLPLLRDVRTSLQGETK